MGKAIPYYRVSTERQGVSGLGLEAQQKAVREYASHYNLELMKEFIEIESGKINNRPILQRALRQCKKDNATLLIAKLDRLGRNILFIATLMESDVDFIAVDNPNATKFVLHIMAAFAEYEREQISQRTKAALEAAKRRGVMLGKNGRLILSKRNKANAIAFAEKMKPIIQSLKQEGFTSLNELTTILNKRKIASYKGDKSRWHKQTVHNLLKRIKQIECEKQIL